MNIENKLVILVSIFNLFVFRSFNSRSIPSAGNKIETHAKKMSFLVGRQQMSIPSDGYDISKSLPANYVRDGSQDYTSFVQNAILSHAHLIFPGFPILISDDGLLIGSDKIINFLPGAEIRLKPSVNKGYNILKITDAENVTINNLIIRADRESHLGQVGEYGHGVGIYSSKNITLNNPHVSDCWGDGIYLGAAKNSPVTNSNIRIIGAVLNHNRRDGISIITVNGLILLNPYAGYSDGTSPMCGINFEPNSPDDQLKNITVTNAKTEYNKGNGISIGLRNLYGRQNQQIDIKIINAKDFKSNVGMKASASLTRKTGSETITGSIIVQSPVWSQNGLSPIQTNLFDNNIRLIIKSPTVIDETGKKLGDDDLLKVLTYKTNVNRDANYSIELEGGKQISNSN